VSKPGKILQKLRGGDRRSIGRANEVVTLVLKDPKLITELLDVIQHDDDPLIRMRSADVLEKVTALHPEWLQPHKRLLINEISAVDQQEVRWHVAQMLPRLQMSPRERAKAVGILERYCEDDSRIVKTFSMQALADLALEDPNLAPKVVNLIKELTRTGSAAVANRGRKLLAELDKS
jgi:hypothetical protein